MKKRILLHISSDQAALNIGSWPGIFARLSAIAPADEHVPDLTDEEEKLVEEKLAQEIDQGDTNPIEALLSVVAVNLQDCGYELYFCRDEFLPCNAENIFHGIIATDMSQSAQNTATLWQLAISNGKLETADGCDWTLSKDQFLKAVAQSEKEVVELTPADRETMIQIPDISRAEQKKFTTLKEIREKLKQLKADKATNIFPISKQIVFLGRSNNSLYHRQCSQTKRLEVIALYQAHLKTVTNLSDNLNEFPVKRYEWQLLKGKIQHQIREYNRHIRQIKKAYDNHAEKSDEQPQTQTFNEINKALEELKQYKEDNIKPVSGQLRAFKGNNRRRLQNKLLKLWVDFARKTDLLKLTAEVSEEKYPNKKEWNGIFKKINRFRNSSEQAQSKLKKAGIKLPTDVNNAVRQPLPSASQEGRSAEVSNPFDPLTHSSAMSLRSTKRSAAPATITSEQQAENYPQKQKAKRPKLN